MIATNGATQEIELPFFCGCTDEELLAAVAAVGFVSARIVVFSVLKKLKYVIEKINNCPSDEPPLGDSTIVQF